MTPDRGFRFAYDPPVIRYGHGVASEVGAEIGALGHDRALVVTGRDTWETPGVAEAVRQGLGDRLVGVVAETAAKKRLRTATRCADRLRESAADVLVAVGGGSSVDVARVASVVAADPRPPAALGSELSATGTLRVPDGLVPTVAVPTTLAGAGLSMLAGVSADPESGLVSAPAAGGVGDPRLMPALAIYDPRLIATTPDEVLAGSAINGFDKGVEALYASTRTPITDATASRGVELLAASLPGLLPDPNPEALAPAVRGVTLAQYGTTRPGGTSFSVLHAIGHALRVHADVQLGTAHGVVAPDALAWLFDTVDGRRQLLAEALGAGDPHTGDADPADAVVDRVAAIRDALELPARLRDVNAVDSRVIDDAAATAAGGFIGSNDAPRSTGEAGAPRRSAHGWSGTPHPPPGLSISESDVREILESAW